MNKLTLKIYIVKCQALDHMGRICKISMLKKYSHQMFFLKTFRVTLSKDNLKCLRMGSIFQLKTLICLKHQTKCTMEFIKTSIIWVGLLSLIE